MALSKITNLSITDDAVRTVGIQDNNVTLAKLGDGTQGDVLYYGASGAPARLGFGTSGDFLKTQGTGANPVWASAGGDNTPSFRVRLSGNQTVSDSTVTKITYDTEDWDTDSAFASNKFTVPSGGAGKYCINMQTMVGSFTGHLTTWYAVVNYIKKNGSIICQTEDAQFLAAGSNFYARSSTCVSLAESDYIEGYIYQKNASIGSKDIDAGSEFTFLEGFLLIGV